MAQAYERVVNGKVVKVNAYGNQSTTTTSAAKKARALPGRPRMAASPGSYSSGRDIPGQAAKRPNVDIPPPGSQAFGFDPSKKVTPPDAPQQGAQG